ncbi:hypothetical protein DM02DRAFT_618039 [Periconia macrospinosa]|uniref:C3H1-type domain-containing protein n=1 Tax=Periconia macrospinosa TaxID=97972 RepID=A0A2V1DB07_9PLEO|nr:hypothetical protein DM02DRAFT_618039 [Periconia macrospinosa]
MDHPPKQSCKLFAEGKCAYGQRCLRVHHHNLDPARRGDKAKGYEDYDVPNEPGKACSRCVQQLRPCDKEGRGGVDDPCSECRHFGGPGCKCVLAPKNTYNNVVWHLMINQPHFDHKLAAQRSRDEPIGRKLDKATGQSTGGNPQIPMPDKDVKPGWRGKTKEQLLAEDDLLPACVRELPRAYVVPPPVDENRKRKADFYKQLESSRSGPASAPAPMMIPPPPSSISELGRCVRATMDVVKNLVIYEYDTGAQITIPAQNPQTHPFKIARTNAPSAQNPAFPHPPPSF